MQNLPRDLLEQADFLTRRESKRPRQASLRRAVSTAYYALFHLLNADAVSLLGPNVKPEIQHRMRRWFNHGEMKKICGEFAKPSLLAPLKDLVGPAASFDMQRVALNFVLLQEARHEADYDTSKTLTRTQAQAAVQQAQDAFASWEKIRKSAEANIFILSLLMWKNWEKERV